LTRGWRALSIGVLAALPVLISAFWTLAFAYAEAQFRRMPVDVRVAVEGLGRLRRAESGRLTLSRQDREAVELALATSYRPALARFKRFPLEYFPWVLPPDNMQIAERLLLTQPTEAEGRGANDHPAVQALVREASKPPDLPPLGVVAISMLGGFFLLAAACSLVAALTFRGGVIRILGLELVTTDGRPASRLRVVGRTLLTWLPLLLGLMAVLAARAIGVPIPGFIVFTSGMGLGLLVTLAAAIFAVARPERGIQDRLAGTWIVPR
jgi:hypothetical protein